MPGSSRVKQGRQKGILVRPDAVRQARLDAGLTLAQVAEGRVTRAAIHLVESGKMRPSIRTLEHIARRTGRPLSYFLPEWEGTEQQRAERDELERLAATEEFDAAVELGERLLAQKLSPGIEADVQFQLGSVYVRGHEGEKALGHLHAAHRFYEGIGDDSMAVEAMDQEATSYFLLNDPRALPTAAEALRRCEQLRPERPGLHVRILLHIGSIYHRDGDWRNAVRFFEKGLEESSALPNPRHIAMMHDGLSVAYQQLGRFSEALNQAQRALALYSMDRDVRSIPRIEDNLGYLLLQQGELDAAEIHLMRALELCEQHGIERQGRANVLCDVGELDIARGRFELGGARLQEARDIAAAYNEPHTEAMALRLLGRMHLKQGADDAADQAFNEAVEIFRQLGAPEELRRCLIEYAEALQDRGLLERSIVYWRQAALAGGTAAATTATEPIAKTS
jgi:tetratricopeptide (TPR) repeat protein